MSEYTIEAQNLTKKFGDFQAVDNLNLKIRKGEVFGFLGPNGAGKTTSINMMVGLLKPTEGKILIDGKDAKSAEKGKIGICPQQLVLWDNLTCKETLMLMGDMYEVPKQELKKRVDKLLDDLILTDKANTLVSNLSGGMKRRMNLAIALIHNPEIVVLDEPSEGLDPQSRRVLWNYITSLRDDQGKTVILTTHLMDEADKLSDRIAIIDHGKLLQLDTPENLKKVIGEGDIIEILLSNQDVHGEIVKTIESMDEIENVAEINGRISIRALNAMNKLPKIMDSIEKADCTVSDMSIRQNTLEDVFIHLTGTSLRE